MSIAKWPLRKPFGALSEPRERPVGHGSLRGVVGSSRLAPCQITRYRTGRARSRPHGRSSKGRPLLAEDLEACCQHSSRLLTAFDDLIVDSAEETAPQRAERLYVCAAHALEAGACVARAVLDERAPTHDEMFATIAQRFNHWEVGPFETAASDYWRTALSVHLTSARATLNHVEDDAPDAAKRLLRLATSLSADAVAGALLADPGPARASGLSAQLEELENEIIHAAADLSQHDPAYPAVGRGLGEATKSAMQGYDLALLLENRSGQVVDRAGLFARLRAELLHAATCELLEVETLDAERGDSAYASQRTIMTAALDRAGGRISWLPLLAIFTPFQLVDGCRSKVVDLAATVPWICKGIKGDQDAIRWSQTETVRQLGNSVIALWAVDRRRAGEHVLAKNDPSDTSSRQSRYW